MGLRNTGLWRFAQSGSRRLGNGRRQSGRPGTLVFAPVSSAVVASGTVCVTRVASEAVFAACPVSGAAVSVRFFVRLRLVIGFDRHKIRLDREVIQGDVVHADVPN